MNIEQHLLRHMAFSHATFGPDKRTEAVVDHIRKELGEVLESAASGEEAEEWVDVVILALDGLTRSLAFECPLGRADPEEVASRACRMIREKQSRNEARSWPDWRTAQTDKAIEHVRTDEIEEAQ